MHPPGNERAALPGGPLKTEYDATNVTDASLKVNGKPMPPDGYAFEGESLVPVTMPPDFTDDEKQRLDVIGPVVEWACGSKSKLAALQFLGGLDTRSVKEIADTHKISASIVHREIKALRAFIGAMRP